MTMILQSATVDFILLFLMTVWFSVVITTVLSSCIIRWQLLHYLFMAFNGLYNTFYTSHLMNKIEWLSDILLLHLSPDYDCIYKKILFHYFCYNQLFKNKNVKLFLRKRDLN